MYRRLVTSGVYPVQGQQHSLVNILAKPSFAEYLSFPLWSTIKEMLRFQTFPLHISQSPQYRSPPSRFPSHSLYKESDAPFLKPLLTCLTQLSEFPVKEPSLKFPSQSCHREREREREMLHHLWRAVWLSFKVPSKRTPLQVSQWCPCRERCLFPEFSFTYLPESPLSKVS